MSGAQQPAPRSVVALDHSLRHADRLPLTTINVSAILLISTPANLTGGPPCHECSSPSTSPTSTRPSTSTRSSSAPSRPSVRPGYANFAIADPPLKLVLMEVAELRGAGRRPGPQPPRRRGGDRPTRWPPPPGGSSDEGLATEVEEQTHLLLRRPGQGLGQRPRRRALGGLHRAGRCAGRARASPATASAASPRRSSACRSASGAVGPTSLVLLLSGRGTEEETREGQPRCGAGCSPSSWAARFLAAIVIGSGIAAQTLSPGNVGLQLFENAAATAAGLFAIILMFGPDLGRPLQPGGLLRRRRLRRADAGGTPPAYLPAQVAGCIGGALLANVMFSKALFEISTKHRASGPHWLSEVVATIGLLLVIFALARSDRVAPRPGGGRCLHRGRLLLHQLDQLRQPGHHRGPDVLQHLRRHRPVLGAELHLGPDRRRRARPSG